MTTAIVGSSLVGAAASSSAASAQGKAARRAAEAQVEAARISAESQERIAERQIGLSREVYDDQTQRFSPFLDAGTNALAAYQYEMGLLPDAPMVGATPLAIEEFTPEVAAAQGGAGPFGDSGAFGQIFADSPASALGGILGPIVTATRLPWQNGSAPEEAPADAPAAQFRVGDQVFSSRAEAEAYARANATGGTQWQGLEMSPAARFALEQGRDAMEAGASARGGLNSGATLAGLERLRMGMAAQDRETQMNRLGGMVDMGQGAAGMQATAGNTFASNANNALGQLGAGLANTAMASGNAQAQGFIGAGNAQAAGVMGAANALSGGVNNLLGWNAYQQMANNPGMTNPGIGQGGLW